jgi:putative thioredoxin
VAIALAKVNIDQEQTLAARYRISSIPAVIAFKDGQPVREFIGALPEAQVRAFLDLLKPSEADGLVQQAQSLVSTDAVSAEKLFRRALALDGKNDEARLGLAQLLLAQGKTDKVSELLDAVASEGERGARARRLTAEAILREKAAGLGDLAAARARLVAEPDDARRRYELGCVLAINGDYAAALAELLAAGEAEVGLASGPVREAMVQIFHALGDQHPLANEYRAKLSRLLY